MVPLFGGCYQLKATRTIPEAISMNSNTIFGRQINQYLLNALCQAFVFNCILQENNAYMNFNMLAKLLID